jgi:DNA-binding MarR family transcriptional regulator
MYIKIPSKLYDINLSHPAIAIYGYMASCSEAFNPSIRYMSQKLGMTTPTIVKYVKELENRNIILRISTGGMKTLNRYSFTDPSTWKEGNVEKNIT